MARINYGAIAKARLDNVEREPNVRAADATVELNASYRDTGQRPSIVVFETRRSAVPLQDIAAGSRQRYRVTWEIWVATFSADSFADAASHRDELIGHIEVALMNNRNLDGLLPAKNLILEGGEFRGGPGAESGYVAEGSIVCSAEVTATT